MSSVEEQLIERDAILDDLKAHLMKSQHKMKLYEDGKKRDVNFEVEDKVYLKLQPYRQNSLAKRTNDKLAARYYGPFRVIQKVGKVAYKLQLPEESRIHPVFHVSQLKLAIGANTANPIIPPQLSPDLVMETEPEELLGVRSRTATASHPSEVLIKWKHLPTYEATWEDFLALTARFPSFHLEDKVALWGASNATHQPNNRQIITYKRRGKKGNGQDLPNDS